MAVLAEAWGECKSEKVSTWHGVENTPQQGVSNILWALELPTGLLF